MRRALKGLAIALATVIMLLLIAVAVVTTTDWGRERVRRIALSILRDRVAGQVQVGRVSGHLLRGVTLHDVVIADSAGAPFIAIDEVQTGYGLFALLRQRIILEDIRVRRPVIVLDKRPGGRWNFQRIFASDTTTPTGAPSRWGQWIVLHDVEVIDGRLVVRAPWTPDDELPPRVRDSLAAAVVAGAGRSEIVRVEGGWQRIMEFSDIDAQLAQARLAHPDFDSRLIAVDTLGMIAAPFRAPLAEVRALAGRFEFNGDSLWFEDTRAALPGSRIAGGGRYLFASQWLALDLRGAPVALADLRWLYPRLPSEGSGTLDFSMRLLDDTSSYIARNADIAVRDSRLAGDFGLTLTDVGDAVIFHDTDLRATTFDTRLIEQLVPNLDLPVVGALTGRAALAGPLTALQVDADLALDETRTGRSRVIARGEVGIGGPGGQRARDLRLEARPVQVALVRAFVDSLPIGGTITGTALVNGSTRTQLATHADLVHTEGTNRSHVVGDARIRLAGRDTWLDVDARARPVALATVGRFTPIELRGVASGPVQVRGTLRDLRVHTDMRVSGGGDLRVTGRLDVASATPAYQAALGFWTFNLNAIVADAPATSLSAQAAVDGRGTDPATMEASLVADVTTSHWNELAVDSAKAHVRIAQGLLRVDTLRVRAPNTLLDAHGAFGLGPGARGELTYRLAVDSLEDFARWLPLDTGVVAPRSGRVRRAIDSAAVAERRLVERTEVERAITGRPAPQVEPDLPPALRRDSVAGSIYTVGALRGGLDRFELHGRASVLGLTLLGHSIGSGRAEYRIAEGGTDRMAIVAAVEAGEVNTSGFEFDSLEARIAHAGSTGDLVVSIRQGDDREYGANARYRLSLEENELQLGRLVFRFDTTVWAATQPGLVLWGPAGVQVAGLELRNGGVGRIYVDAFFPRSGDASVILAVDNFQIGHLVDLLQVDVPIVGQLSIAGNLEGPLSNPRFGGALGLFDGSYGGTRIPQLNATFEYADRTLETDVVASRQGGMPLASATATLPLNLAITGVRGPRVLNLPMRAELVADSLPLDLLPQVTDQVENVRGRVIGSVAARGTPRDPVLAGALALDLGSFGIASTGMTVRDIVGFVRLSGDTIVVDSLVGWAGGPVRVAGGLGVADWTAPSFDLALATTNALVLDNDQGRLRADAEVTMRGPFDRVRVDGTARIREGVVYVEESRDRDVVNARDPALFAIVDTSVVTVDEIIPEESPLLRNVRLNVDLQVDRDTWVRNTNANVEVYGRLTLNIDQRRNAFAVEGSVNTDRGQYTYLSRRFQITRGSATFIGGPQLDPLLQITGSYEVPIAGREALNIRILIGGTLSSPNLTLESDAQPPISQTDLISYLAFGRSGSGLLTQTTTLSGAGGSGELVGVGAALAGEQLTSVALGVAVSEFEGEASRDLGLDVLNITPGELPPEFWRADLGGFLRGTEVEMGWYTSSNLFLALQAYPDGRIPGARVEYRFGQGFQLDGVYETRYIAREPTLRENLADQLPRDGSWGLFLTKEWRFSSRRTSERRVGQTTSSPAPDRAPARHDRGTPTPLPPKKD